MPCSLEKMLSNHAQSMFEYLAPRRGGGGRGGAAAAAQGAAGGQNHPHAKAEGHQEGYKDVVY